jgi:hypothetical protein
MLNKSAKKDSERRATIHQMMGKAHLILGKNLQNKGHVYPAIMAMNKAISDLQAAYNIFDKLKRLERTYFISILGDLSAWHSEKQDHLSAHKLLRKQLRMAQKYLSSDDPSQWIYLKYVVEKLILLLQKYL